jgi:hypothetical protein
MLPSFAAGDVQGSSTAIDQQGHTVFASMFPSSGIYMVVVDGGQIKDLKKVSDSLPAEIKSDTSAKSPATDIKTESGPYTSLIVDARGFGVDRAMSPKVRKTDGSEVWGTLSVTPDFAIENGVVSYATSMEMAMKSSRCGKNPLVIKAVGKSVGGAACDVLISDEDASRVLSEDSAGKFLNTCRVVFIVD